MKNNEWSNWSPFPDPKSKGYLYAPFGPGVYQLRLKGSEKYILFGQSKNVAHRRSSLLPAPYGAGVRHNDEKRRYVLANIQNIEYRTMACDTAQEAKAVEKELHCDASYKFKT